MKEFSVSIECAGAGTLAVALEHASHVVLDHAEAINAMAVDDSMTSPVPNSAAAVVLTRHA